jgi:hypothetical protein
MAETLPPLTAAAILEPLRNSTFSVYIYVGNTTDDGWKVAKIIFGLLSRIRVYCATDPSLVKEWAPGQSETYSGGIVFGWGEEPVSYLTKKQADNLQATLEAIEAARA